MNTRWYFVLAALTVAAAILLQVTGDLGAGWLAPACYFVGGMLAAIGIAERKLLVRLERG